MENVILKSLKLSFSGHFSLLEFFVALIIFLSFTAYSYCFVIIFYLYFFQGPEFDGDLVPECHRALVSMTVWTT